MDRNLRIRLLLEAGDRVTKPLRDIAQGSSRTAAALKATRDRLKDIERAQADVSGFRELKAGLRSTERELASAQDRVARIAREMAEAEKPTRKLAAEFARAKREAAALKTEHGELASRTQATRDRLAAAGIATSNLATEERKLRHEAERTTAELGQQERQLRELTDRSRRFAAARDRFSRVQGTATGLAAGGAAGIGTGIAVGTPLAASVRAATEFESAMTDIGQKADLTRDRTRLMGLELIKAARAANQLPAAMQEGVDTLAGFGLAVPDARAMVTPIGRAATAYKAEMKDMAAASFAAHDNLKVPIADTARMIDVMAAAGKAGAFEMKDMAQFFPELTAGYQALGQKGLAAGADLAAALQITRKGTGDSASAATNLSNILQKMASPDTIKNFEKMGVDLPAVLKRMYAEGKTPIEAIADLTNKTLKGDLSRLGFLFGDAQVQQGLRPLIQNMEEYRRIREQAGAANGTTDRDFADRMQDGAEKMKRAQIQAKALSITLGTALLPLTTALADRFGAIAERVSGWAQRNPRLASGLAVTAAVVAGLFLLLGGGAIILAGLVAPFAALSAAAGFLGVGLLPVIGIAAGVVAAVVAIAAAAYLIYSNWDAITGWFSRIWETIRTTFLGAVAWVSALPGRFVESGRNMIRGLIAGITGMLGALKSTIVNAASSAANWFKEKLGIRSPSRVFMGLGGFVMAGLDRGIADGADAPVDRLDALSRRMQATMRVQGRLASLSGQIGAAVALGAATPAPSAPAGAQAPAQAGQAAAVGGGSITINIFPQAGQSAQDIARAVRDELAAERRKGEARSRSSYSDTPEWR